MTEGNCLSIPWRVLSLGGLVGVVGASLGLLVWGTVADLPAMRAWGLWLGGMGAAWGVVFAQGHLEIARRRRLAREERLAQVMELDPGRH